LKRIIVLITLILLIGCSSNNKIVDEQSLSFIKQQPDGVLMYLNENQVYAKTDQEVEAVFGQKLEVDWNGEYIEESSNVMVVDGIKVLDELGDQFEFNLASNQQINEDGLVELHFLEIEDSNLTLEVFNKSDEILTFGLSYQLERLIDEEWKRQNFLQEFPAEGIELEPHQSMIHEIDLFNNFPRLESSPDDLYTGTYRLLIAFNHSKLPYALQFEIK
jgi:maltodextrin utilization protein YvdJ